MFIGVHSWHNCWLTGVELTLVEKIYAWRNGQHNLRCLTKERSPNHCFYARQRQSFLYKMCIKFPICQFCCQKDLSNIPLTGSSQSFCETLLLHLTTHMETSENSFSHFILTTNNRKLWCGPKETFIRFSHGIPLQCPCKLLAGFFLFRKPKPGGWGTLAGDPTLCNFPTFRLIHKVPTSVFPEGYLTGWKIPEVENAPPDPDPSSPLPEAYSSSSLLSAT